jgi:DNA-binding CsgD family transcriptional regulator
MHRFVNFEQQRAFRAAIVDAAAQPAQLSDTDRIWRDLKQGKACLLDAFSIENTSYLVVVRQTQHEPVPEAALEVLERVLLGAYPKQIALDTGMATSTLVGVMRLALRGMGVTCKPSKVPLGLVALVRSALATDERPTFYVTKTHVDGVECQVLSTRLSSTENVLPPAVGAVLRLLAEGKTHREIAYLRGKSERTIANQLATAFARIGDSGRISAIRFLLSAEGSTLRSA